MDPNAALKNIREAVGELRNQDDDGVLDNTSQVGFLLESIEALDEWLGKGGFLPTAWQRAGQGDADDVTIRPTTSCGCGYPLVWVDGHWEHDVALYLWGNDHEPDEPAPTGGAREYWDEEDGVTEPLVDDEGRCEHGYFLTGGTGTCPMPREEHKPRA